MHNVIKVAIADNHAEYCEALSCFLADSGFTIVLSAAAGPGLLQLLDPLRPPDLLIIGCSTMYPESIALIRELKSRFPSTKVLANVVFTHYLPEAWLNETCIDGWIVKTMVEPAAIIKAIRKACGL